MLLPRLDTRVGSYIFSMNNYSISYNARGFTFRLHCICHSPWWAVCTETVSSLRLSLRNHRHTGQTDGASSHSSHNSVCGRRRRTCPMEVWLHLFHTGYFLLLFTKKKKTPFLFCPTLIDLVIIISVRLLVVCSLNIQRVIRRWWHMIMK